MAWKLGRKRKVPRKQGIEPVAEPDSTQSGQALSKVGPSLPSPHGGARTRPNATSRLVARGLCRTRNSVRCAPVIWSFSMLPRCFLRLVWSCLGSHQIGRVGAAALIVVSCLLVSCLGASECIANRSPSHAAAFSQTRPPQWPRQNRPVGQRPLLLRRSARCCVLGRALHLHGRQDPWDFVIRV